MKNALNILIALGVLLYFLWACGAGQGGVEAELRGRGYTSIRATPKTLSLCPRGTQGYNWTAIKNGLPVRGDACASPGFVGVRAYP